MPATQWATGPVSRSGWLYWYFWVIVVGFEAIAGAKIIQYWIDVPLWLSALILMVLMTATNLFSVSSFGEFEFWFAGIKVAAIIVFIGLGVLFVFGRGRTSRWTSPTCGPTAGSSRSVSWR